MSGCELRAHHALCVGFYRGMGYSPAFTAFMTQLVGTLRASDALLTLRSAADGLCLHCPHSHGDVCDSAGKVARYDAAALRLLGLPEGATVRRSQLAALARERIVDALRLDEVCGDCQWHRLCAAEVYHL